ncbi:MAG TPA: DUF3829 domain-containing protein [Ignavibacteria bacterium]|nr:DUF3829 domain-containing protein [Ignavibacteria bacterium]HMR41293.1 DUF3829 domain-containing protein [Ignavibacteria bacterium]
MHRIKFISTFVLAVLIFLSCSLTNKLKEKLSSKKEETEKEEPVKEQTKTSSKDEMAFYNSYIEVMNKVQEVCNNVNKSYYSDIPAPENLSKNTFLVPVGFSLATQSLENQTKQYRRSLYDGGPLSKLDAPDEMKNAVETNFKNTLAAMEEYSEVSKKVSAYYSDKIYKEDISKAKSYDEEMKTSYDKYNTLFRLFSASVKDNKPERDKRDPDQIKDPDERSSTIVVNAYGDILDAAENFFEKFDGMKYKEDISGARSTLEEFQKVFNDSKQEIVNAEYTETTKFMKYSFEDYFDPAAVKFMAAGKDFTETAPAAKNEAAFNKIYNSVIESYNRMIDSYNTNISMVNRVRNW